MCYTTFWFNFMTSCERVRERNLINKSYFMQIIINSGIYHCVAIENHSLASFERLQDACKMSYLIISWHFTQISLNIIILHSLLSNSPPPTLKEKFILFLFRNANKIWIFGSFAPSPALILVSVFIFKLFF